MGNLNQMGLVEISTKQMRETDGGFLLLVAYYALYKAGEVVVDAVEGAYEAGHDAGENNCECH